MSIYSWSCSTCGLQMNGYPDAQSMRRVHDEHFKSESHIANVTKAWQRIRVDDATGYILAAEPPENVDTISGATLREVRDNLLDFATDEQIRREAAKRGMNIGACDCAKIDAALKADRDEWKRRAEAAEAEAIQLKGALAEEVPECRRTDAHRKAIASAFVMRGEDVRGVLAWDRSAESGPGIAARPPRLPIDDHWVDPWDFLEDE